MRVWVTRARPGADRTAERLTALGFTPLVVPLLTVGALDPDIDLSGIHALAFTSVNGVAAFSKLSDERVLPVFTVGDATARAARGAGFASVRSAGGDLSALAVLIQAEARDMAILHLGATEAAGDLAVAVGDAATVRSIAVYTALETRAIPPRDWDAVLIHSPRAARALADHEVASSRVAVAISPNTAAPLANLGFSEIRIAATPTETALLAALGKPEASV